MKKIFLIFSLILFPFISIAQTTTDTLLNVTNPEKVTITESSQGTRISLGDGRETFLIEYPDSSKVSTSRSQSRAMIDFPSINCGRNTGRQYNAWSLGVDGICIGLNDALGQTGGGGLQWSKSFEIGWLSCLNIGYSFGRSRVYLGIGLNWRNYKSTLPGQWLQPDGSGGVQWGSAPEGVDVRSTNFQVFSLQLPLMYRWAIPKSALKLEMGPILNFNTSAQIKGVYNDRAGNRCEYYTKDFDRRPVTLDFFGALSYRNAVGLYVRYSPMKLLKNPSPVNFAPLTVGVTLLL